MMGVRIEVRDGESSEQAVKRFKQLVGRYGPPGAGRKRPKWHKRPLEHYLKPSELRRRDELRDVWATYWGECARRRLMAIIRRRTKRRKERFGDAPVVRAWPLPRSVPWWLYRVAPDHPQEKIMTALMTRPVAMDDWQAASSRRDGNGAARSAAAADSGRSPAVRSEADRWEAIVDEIGAMQHLGDKWDGLNAVAPSRELLESAIGLAYVLCDNGMDPPTAIAPGLDGSVNFEWHLPDGTFCEVEVPRPFYAEVMLIEPGQPARHWTLPTD